MELQIYRGAAKISNGVMMTQEDAFASSFPSYSIWRSREEVYKAANYLGCMYGFSIRKEKESILCTRSSKPCKKRQMTGGLGSLPNGSFSGLGSLYIKDQ